MQPRFILQPLLFLALSLYSLAPALPHLSSAVPTPAHGARTVPLFNAWTILWNSLQLHQGLPNYWQAPIFFPESRAFAFSEPQPATLLLAPLKPHRNNPALAYNCWLILSLTLNGIFAARLLRWLDTPLIFNSAASATIVLHPLLHHQLDSAQLTPVWPSIWTITAILQLQQLSSTHRPRLKHVTLKGFEIGLACCATAACALHHALFLALLIILTSPTAIPFKYLRNWLPGATAALLPLLPLLPAALVIQQALAAPHYTREESLINQLSAQPTDFFRSPPGAILNHPKLVGNSFFPLNPGWLRLLAALTAALAASATLRPHAANPSPNTKQTNALRFLTALTLTAALLALGSRLQFGTLKIWPILAHYIPGFAQVRSPFRFGYFYQTTLLLLAAQGLTILHNKITRSPKLQHIPRLQRSFAVLAAFTLALETLPNKIQLVGIPDPAHPPAWVTAVQQHLPEGHGLLVLPQPPNASAAAYEDTTRRMIHATAHNIPLVIGYSGFFPPAHYELLKQLQHPLTPQLINQLRSQNISAILSTSEISTNQLLQSSPNALSVLWQHAPSQTTLLKIHVTTPR